jgi:hypothetical protein
LEVEERIRKKKISRGEQSFYITPCSPGYENSGFTGDVATALVRERIKLKVGEEK